jgi:hypothetical protein
VTRRAARTILRYLGYAAAAILAGLAAAAAYALITDIPR